MAKGQLGWEPTISLRKGLRETIDYFSDVIAQTPREPALAAVRTQDGAFSLNAASR